MSRFQTHLPILRHSAGLNQRKIISFQIMPLFFRFDIVFIKFSRSFSDVLRSGQVHFEKLGCRRITICFRSQTHVLFDHFRSHVYASSSYKLVNDFKVCILIPASLYFKIITCLTAPTLKLFLEMVSSSRCACALKSGS